MITIKRMAELAGVSPTTVSNVLHGRFSKISKEKLELVQAVIKDSNYVSNMGGRLLGNYGSKIIAVIIAYKQRDSNRILQPFTGEIISALEHEITKSGYFMMLYTNEDVEECMNMARAWNVEGLILLGFSSKEYVNFKACVEVPIVAIDTGFEGVNSKYINIGLQDYEGGTAMGKYLLKCGHRNIALLALGLEEGSVDGRRGQGILDTLNQQGVDMKKEDLICLDDEAEKRQKFLLELAREKFRGYTALFFSSDYLAIEAINTFLDAGYHIPNDISITGFDDIQAATQCRPKLTTVRQDIAEKGRMSVAELIQVIETKVFKKKNILLPIEVVERDTVRKLG